MASICSAFYKFVEIGDPAALKPALLDACFARSIKGSILLAYEGINGTISGEVEKVADFFDWLRGDPRFADLETRDSPANEHPFGRLKVRLKREIVTLGVAEANPARAVGIYVEPEDWNGLIEQPDIVLVDARNAYEVIIGSFKNAIDPKTRAFRQFPDFVRDNLDPARHKRIATFCTGGIRCEKATSFLIQQGFEEVYHLRGGILNYLETVPRDKSLWEGECFVFDERVALGHGVDPGSHVMCRTCGGAIPAKGTDIISGDVSCEACAGSARPAFSKL